MSQLGVLDLDVWARRHEAQKPKPGVNLVVPASFGCGQWASRRARDTPTNRLRTRSHHRCTLDVRSEYCRNRSGRTPASRQAVYALRTVSSIPVHGDDLGQLGDGAWRDHMIGFVGAPIIRPSPIEVPGLSGVVDVSMNAHNTCAVLSDSTVACWGELLHAFAEWLPNGQAELRASTPTLVARTVDAVLEGVTKVIAGAQTTSYGLLSDGHVVLWGVNFVPQISKFNSPVATACPELFGAIDIVGRWALLRSGGVLRDRQRLPFDRCVVAIGELDGHACMGLDDGTVGCWEDEPKPHFVVLP